MLSNYALIAWRRLSREKAYVLISIASLALGIAGFLVLALYLRSELTYDRHHANHERIYRLNAQFTSKSMRKYLALTQNGLGPLLVRDFPQLGRQVRFQRSAQDVFTYEANTRQWDGTYIADPTVFEIFTHKILYGDPRKAFDDPYALAVSESFARHYFGDENPIGKKVTGGALSHVITLVFEDLPENTHFKYDVLVPISLLDTMFTPPFSSTYTTSLWNSNLYTYLMVPEDFDLRDFEAIGDKFFDAYMAEQSRQFKETFRPRLQKLTDIHFDAAGPQFDRPTGNIFYVYGFAAVALFILIVACINYVNLATARAAKRAKEVGMRKVLGAERSQLMAQFLSESFTFTAIALVLALIVIALVLTVTPLASLMNKQALLSQLLEPAVAGGIVGVAIVVALAAGLYPALYLSSISPLAALTHVRRSWQTGFSLRQILVFAQLTISIAVIACTMLMIDQMRYVHSRPLGFDKENRLIVQLRGYDALVSTPIMKAELRRLQNVVDVTTITSVPGTGNAVNQLPVETNEGTMEPTSLHRIAVGLNFVQAMKLQMVEGRPLSEDIATDLRQGLLVNESFVRMMGWTQPLGKRMTGSTDEQGRPLESRVVGVVKDFHYASLRDEIGPLLMHGAPDRPFGQIPENVKPFVSTAFIVVMTGEDMQRTIDSIYAVIKRFNPKFVFEPAFLEDRLDDLYKMETNLMKLTGLFAGVCIFISIMGIFGLAAFTTEQRTKEIGIRKVLGAADSQIVTMLTRPLLWLVLAAAIPASYAGYRAIDAWLRRFAYHTEIRPLTFVFATFAVALIAIGTVVLQSLRTTNANPVDALRYE